MALEADAGVGDLVEVAEEKTWNPPLSVTMGPGQAMKRWRSPRAATVFSPGRSMR